MRRLLITIFALLTAFGTAMAIDKNTVEVAYNGDKVVVNIADNINDYVTVAIEVANVKITQSDKVADNAPGEIYYILSGSSTNGSFYLSGSYKCSVTLNGLNLTNPNGPAIDIQNGKRVNLLATGRDASSARATPSSRARAHSPSTARPPTASGARSILRSRTAPSTWRAL